jgi:hypothetical protein
VPDLVMVGGVNGSGKTTLLELIARMARLLFELDTESALPTLAGWNAWIDFRLTSEAVALPSCRVVLGSAEFLAAHRTEHSVLLLRRESELVPSVLQNIVRALEKLRGLVTDPKVFAASSAPGVVYFPTDRQLVIPAEPYKAAGHLNGTASFIHRVRPVRKWSESIEAVLYAARWADLNSKEQGRPEAATHFEAYAKAFEGFFGDTKKLVWTPEGELVVKVADTGQTHPIDELSSGEKQILLFCAELYRRWRPGSLILIDEPELHLHPSWQTTLWTLLERWQKERGGQVIVATQSSHLFGVAEPGTAVLLGQALS